MTESTARILKEQGLFQNLSPKKWENPFPDFTLEEKLPLKLVGYARSLVKVSFFRKSYRLSLSDEYLIKVWSENGQKISRTTVYRRLNELQQAGVLFISTDKPQRLPDGNWKQDREIILIPEAKKEKKIYPCVSEMKHQMKSLSKDSDRTIQKEEKQESSFIDTNSLSKIEPEKKQEPDKLTKRIQISFLKKAIERILDEDELNYRFMCLLLRKCFGANDQTIKYYGSVLHLQLRHKPETVASSLELMVKTYSGIRKPVGYLISELQSIIGKIKKKTISVELIQPKLDFDERRKKIRTEPRDLVKLQGRLDKQKLEKLRNCDSKMEPHKNNLEPQSSEENSKKEFGRIVSLLRKHTE